MDLRSVIGTGSVGEGGGFGLMISTANISTSSSCTSVNDLCRPRPVTPAPWGLGYDFDRRNLAFLWERLDLPDMIVWRGQASPRVQEYDYFYLRESIVAVLEMVWFLRSRFFTANQVRY